MSEQHGPGRLNGAASAYATGYGAPYTAVSRPVPITFFRDYRAASKTEDVLSLAALAELIDTTTAGSKEALPWLKLATFGEQRTKHGSLRHNANVLELSGVEADYDGDGNLSVADALGILKRAGVLAVFYTSPSHCDDESRFRILCPTSTNLSPDRRAGLVARLNGLFGGVFSRESFALSQSFYFGRVRNNPSHLVTIIAGRPIDLLDGLDRTAVGPKQAYEPDPAERAAGAYRGLSQPRIDGFIRKCLDTVSAAPEGQKHHVLLRTARSLGGIQAEAGFSESEAIGWLIERLPATVEDWERARKTAQDGLRHGRSDPIELPDRPNPKALPRDNDGPSEDDDGWPGPDPEKMRTEQARQDFLPFVTFDELDDEPGEVQDFVEGLLTRGTMSVIYGEPQAGKSFFVVDLALRIASGMPWRDRDVEPGAVLYLALEGSHGIQNRIRAFKKHHGLSGLPFALVTVSVNLLDPNADTELLIATVREVTKRFPQGVSLVVVDTLARAMAGGNENSAEDMGALVRNGDRIREVTGAHVLWVHHSGKDVARGARGHSSLRGATDTEIEITSDTGSRIARVTKQRDMECTGEFVFKLKAWS